MYGAIREHTLQPGKLGDVARRSRGAFVPIISKSPAFVSYSFVHVGGDSRATTA